MELTHISYFSSELSYNKKLNGSIPASIGDLISLTYLCVINFIFCHILLEKCSFYNLFVISCSL